VQGIERIERINIFGVRHLSPAASWHLLRLLERVKPKLVLIEGPSDASGLIKYLLHPGVRTPVAILAYTQELPVDTVLYPLAEYAPEYQAIRFAGERARFIDLPSDVLLGLSQWEKSQKTDEPIEDSQSPEQAAARDLLTAYHARAQSVYEEIAQLDQAQSYDDYFEKNFEHNLNEGSFQKTMWRESAELRQILEPLEAEASPRSSANNLIREAYMAMQIQAALQEGFEPEEIVVVTGAYHAERLLHTTPMTDAEFQSLPRRASQLTLMPYSYYRLSSRTGYGAGNKAPAYYQLMWECMKAGRLEELPSEYMARLGQMMREGGAYAGTSNVIEAVRLARGLACIRGGSLPTLSDLHEGAIACLGHGDASETATAFAYVDVGTAFGELPEGVSQTPIQDDFNREIRRLKMERFKSTVATRLELDLRENIRVKSDEAAFLDLNRSTFLHRLAFLGISFAVLCQKRQNDATWREEWDLQWTPEAEIQLLEAVLKGETVELAAAYALQKQLDDCADVFGAAGLISSACVCKLTTVIGSALSTLQRLTAQASDFVKAADACYTLSQLIQYGDLRHFDTEPLKPLLKQLFLRGALLLTDYAGCDDKAAAGAVSAIEAMHRVSQENVDLIDDDAWVKELFSLAARDDKNAKLSGLAFAVLLERNLADEDFCAREVARRLSPGSPADLGAGWFEGMSMRNRYALLSRVGLWKKLDAYIQSLDDEEFKRGLVYLRRAFASFEPREKNSAAELLGELWQTGKTGSQEVAILLQSPLNEAEEKALSALDDFDFDA